MNLTRFAVTLLAFVAVGAAAAQSCTHEIEPNDVPGSDTPLTDAGPNMLNPPADGRSSTLCLTGSLSDRDQDFFEWTVTEEYAGQIWNVHLEGMASDLTRLAIMRFDFAPDGSGVLGYDTLLVLEALHGQTVTSPDFMLAPGRYTVGFTGSGASGEYVALLEPAALLSRRGSAYAIDTPRSSAFGVYGTSSGTIDQTWQLDDDAAANAWRVSTMVAAGEAAQLSLHGPSGELVRVATNSGEKLTLDSLGLTAGQYTLRVEGNTGPFLLETQSQGRITDGHELEPNNSFATANLFPPGSEMRGTTTDSDHFRIPVGPDQAGFWTLELQAAGNYDIRLRTEDGQDLLTRRGVQGAIENLYLPAGDYGLQVDGPRDSSGYVLSLQPGQPAQDGWEREPNDHVASATPMGPEGQIRGQHTGTQDTDIFMFEVAGEGQLYRVQAGGSELSELAYLNSAGQEQARTSGSSMLRLDGLALTSGRHYFRVRGDAGQYALRLLAIGPIPAAAEEPPPSPEPLAAATPAAEVPQPADPAEAEVPPPPPAPPGVLELEPNDDTTRAGVIMPGQTYVGTLSSTQDRDYWRFYLTGDQLVRIELMPPANVAPLPLSVDGVGRGQAVDSEPGSPTVLEEWLQAGDYTIQISGGDTLGGYYQLRLSQLNSAGHGLEGEAATSLSMQAAAETDMFAAYWHEGQQVSVSATITNPDSQPRELELHTSITDARATVSAPDSIQLAAGETRQVQVDVTLPADLRSDLPLTVSMAASGAGEVVRAQTSLQATCEALPWNPLPGWSLPASLLGRMNVLWSGLGAQVHGADAGWRDLALIDGRVSPATGGYALAEDAVVYALAGTEPWSLVGALLHPLNDSAVRNTLQQFRVETSLDAVSWSTAFEGELQVARFEQSFEFPAPVTARYVRLVGMSGSGTDRLGSFKLLAQDAQPLGQLNLADLALGGHVSWSEPLLPNRGQDMLSAAPFSRTISHNHPTASFAIGFLNARAAQISSIEWHDAADAFNGGFTTDRVLIEVSLDGPAGPWQVLDEWTLERSADGRARLDLPQPEWARYLKFTYWPAAEYKVVAPPERLVVYERPSSGDYLSALGEWGMASQDAIFEFQQPPAVPVSSADDQGNDTMATATPVASGTAVAGTVEVAADVDWLKFSIAPGHNHLRLQLSGEPAIDYVYELVDAAGAPVAYSVRGDDQRQELTFYGDPGDYYLLIEEPRRTVIFTWDTSASMGPYLDLTYSAIASFARDVNAERESVQLLAFEDPPLGPQWLLPIWSADTQRVQRAVNGYQREHHSSNSELALRSATSALEGREGTRAILLVTDAESDGYGLTPDLWTQFDSVRPRMFTFEVSSGGSLFSQQLMQDWAAVNSGSHVLATSVGELLTGFDRASCILRRPKHYQVEVLSSSQALPGPGQLQVSRAPGAAQPAVEIILDASGSMGAPLPDGQQRIEAALDVVEQLITQVLPAEAPFALRAFGHVTPSSCDTRLELPLGPLDSSTALAALRAIEPKLLSQTPLAESLEAVAADLSTAGLSRTVILITDGVESCGGDPVAAVQALRAQHPVDLAIVSLDLGPEDMQVFQDLADAVGARYVDVSSFEHLQQSVLAALNPAFEVFDAAGNLVATGQVDGDAVPLEMGVYSVRVAGGQVFQDVRIAGDDRVALSTR